MAKNINSVQPVDPRGPVAAVRQVFRVQGRPAPRLIIDAFDKGELPVYLQKFLATEGGRYPQRTPSRKSVSQAARKMPPHIVARAAEAAIEPRKVVHLAIHQIALKDPSQAALVLDRLAGPNVLKPQLRKAMFDAISHEDPKVRAANLHAVFTAHADEIGHKAFEEQIKLAHKILEEDYQTFEAINKNWNDAMREAADANKKASERAAQQKSQITRQQNARRQETLSEKASRAINELTVQSSIRARITRLMRRPPTAAKTVYTSASVAVTSPVEAVSSAVGVEEVAFTDSDGRTQHAKRFVSPAVSSSSFSRPLSEGLEQPIAAAAGVNIGLGIGGPNPNRAILVR